MIGIGCGQVNIDVFRQVFKFIADHIDGGMAAIVEFAKMIKKAYDLNATELRAIKTREDRMVKNLKDQMFMNMLLNTVNGLSINLGITEPLQSSFRINSFDIYATDELFFARHPLMKTFRHAVGCIVNSVNDSLSDLARHGWINIQTCDEYVEYSLNESLRLSEALFTNQAITFISVTRQRVLISSNPEMYQYVLVPEEITAVPVLDNILMGFKYYCQELKQTTLHQRSDADVKGNLFDCGDNFHGLLY